ncbi:MAG: FkbM family methyltransferase [Kiritimatiellae bacterium]|nr:FkbM family methyltransferase [Kiritimatiellia bacterium]
MKAARKLYRGLRHPAKALRHIHLALLQKSGRREPLIRKLKCADVRLCLDPRDVGISRDLYLEGIRERHATAAYMECLRPGQVVLDIGANIGYYVLIAAAGIGPSGHVFAVEPDQHNLDLLRRSIALNGFEDRIDVERGAVSDHNGTATLHVAKQSNLHTLARTPSMTKYVEFTGEVEVPVFTLDSWVERKGIDPAKIGVVRMDIEGHEAAALRGMLKTLRAAQDVVLFVEVHPRIIRETEGEAGYAAFVETLAALGFEVRFAAASLWSREDRPIEMKEVRELLQHDRAVEVLLVRSL